jgi:NAD(P)-dependent dehydrogenase (short-subunit alcohol dehydrogenase family)
MTTLDQLRGRVAVVSGSGSGIGEGLVRYAATQVAMPVAVTDVDGARAEAVAASLRADGADAHAWPLDVTDADAVRTVAAEILDRWGPPGLVGCNAGIEFTGPLWRMTPAQWAAVQSVNVNGVFNLAHAFVPAMIEDARPSHVLVTSSIGGLSTAPAQGAYLVSKHAVRVFAQCLQHDLEEISAPVGVSLLLPGAVDTAIFRDADGSAGDGEAVRDTMRTLLADEGMSPGQVAEVAFAGIDQGRTWIHTHPDQSRALVDAHCATLSAGLPV